MGGICLEKEFLSPPPPPPAIRDAMAKAVERKMKGLPTFDFSSGNVGNLLLRQKFFEVFKIEISEFLPKELKQIAEGLREGLIESYYPNPRGLAYSPTGGTELIKKLVIKYFREIHGVPLSDNDVDKVVVTAGGQQAMTAALRSLKPETRVLLSRWDYSPIPGIIRDHNLKEIRVKANEDLSISIDDLKEKVNEGAIFYISMPNNPTGYVSPEDLMSIAEVMSINRGGLIWDAPYLFTIIKLNEKHATFDKIFLQEIIEKFKQVTEKYYDDMCILSSLSKTCLIAGLRFGFATACKEWIANMEAIIGRENLSSPTPSFIAGTHLLRKFLENPTSYEWICRVLANRLTILMEEIHDYLILPKNGIFGALYALIKTGETDGKVFANRLIEKYGIVTVPANSFYGGPVNAVRLSLVSVPWSEGDEEWISSVKALKQALHEIA
ncbi:hypothetical protein DRO54_11440 [Candidatus Bathyarchaeota archaeon]|nr:MAG: hypothetical protein DRO54_11440 [Candidatus Bathyarchaeota archaeon]